MIASTQDHLPVQEIRDDIVLLKDGSLAVVIQTSAVNFGLLSENEQLAIISAFAAMLNSLSFMIQVIIRSKRLDISSYLKQLDEAQTRQKNQLLASMIGRYRTFIKNTIQENQVLDKQFYIVIPVSYLETGAISKAVHYDFKKALTIATPRRDQIMRQLARIGLKSNQLRTEELIKLFYDIYNPTDLPPEAIAADTRQTQQAAQTLGAVMAANAEISGQVYRAAPDAELIKSEDLIQQEQKGAQPAPVAAPPLPVSDRPETPFPAGAPVARPAQVQQVGPRRKPYVVEELKEDYGTV